jgi:predicted translin family RNA/ssDNA-binding protein
MSNEFEEILQSHGNQIALGLGAAAINQRNQLIAGQRSLIDNLQRQFQATSLGNQIQQARFEIEEQRLQLERVRLSADEAERELRRHQLEQSRSLRRLLADTDQVLRGIDTNRPSIVSMTRKLAILTINVQTLHQNEGFLSDLSEVKELRLLSEKVSALVQTCQSVNACRSEPLSYAEAECFQLSHWLKSIEANFVSIRKVISVLNWFELSGETIVLKCDSKPHGLSKKLLDEWANMQGDLALSMQRSLDSHADEILSDRWIGEEIDPDLSYIANSLGIDIKLSGAARSVCDRSSQLRRKLDAEFSIMDSKVSRLLVLYEQHVGALSQVIESSKNGDFEKAEQILKTLQPVFAGLSYLDAKDTFQSIKDKADDAMLKRNQIVSELKDAKSRVENYKSRIDYRILPQFELRRKVLSAFLHSKYLLSQIEARAAEFTGTGLGNLLCDVSSEIRISINDFEAKTIKPVKVQIAFSLLYWCIAFAGMSAVLVSFL